MTMYAEPPRAADHFTPTADTDVATYLEQFWLPRRLPTWSEGTRRRPMRLHDARHTHLTHLLRSGEPIQNVSARAGHGSSFTTLSTYAHVIAGDDERTARRAAGLFGD